MPEAIATEHTACPVCAETKFRAWGTHGRYHLRQCRACSFIYVQERMSADFYATFYQAQAADPNVPFNPENVKKFSQMLHDIQALGLPGKRILDVGCGNGIFLSVASEAGFQATGIDTDEARVAGCVARGLRATCGRLPHPELNEPVDLIWCSHIIEHIDEPHLFLETVEQQLQPGGVLAILTPNFGGLAGQICGRHFRKVIPPEHLSYYSEKSLGTLAQQRGWIKERVYTQDARLTLKEIMAYLLKVKFLNAPTPLSGAQPFAVEQKSKPVPQNNRPGLGTRISHAFAPIMHWFGGDELVGYFRKPETTP